jgi:amino acid transporter
MRVTNDIPFGCSLLLPVGTVICVQTLKVQNPGRAYPIGLIASVFTTMFTYILPVAGGVLVLPYDRWGESALKDVAEASAGNWLQVWITFSAFIGCIGTFLSITATTSLGLKCLSDLGIAPKCFAYEHPTLKTPIVSILFCSILTGGNSARSPLESALLEDNVEAHVAHLTPCIYVIQYYALRTSTSPTH